MKQCDCRVCVRSRAFDKHIENLDDDQRNFFIGLHETLLQAEFDLDVSKSVIDGSFSTADLWIKRAREKREKVDNDDEN
jgi:hypothetical protein